MNQSKTYARELSVVLLLWLGYLSHDPVNLETLKVLVLPFMGFVLAAFSFKQPTVSQFMQRSRSSQHIAGFGNERRGEHASGEVQLTDNRSDK